MSREAYSPPDQAGWLARGFRLIVFTTEPQQRAPREWWRELTGNEPEESSRRKEVVEQAGPLEGTTRRLTVTVDPMRIQWSLDPVVPAEQIIEGVPTLGRIVEEKDRFLALMDGWLQHTPTIKRIGFFVSAIYRTTNHRNAYILLDRLLETVDVDSDSTDFMYRVNRKIRSRVDPQTMINQLGTWIALKITASVAPLVSGQAEQYVVNEDAFVSVELDVNTNQERIEAFAAEALPRFYRELADLAVTRATQGDRRG